MRKLAQDYDGQLHILRREALILLYSHLLRLDIQDAALKKRASISSEPLKHRTDYLGPTGQETVLLQTPLLLNALLNISISRNWLSPSLFVMRLQAYLAQALPPTAAADNQFLRSLEEKDDPKIIDVKKKVMERWGRVEIVDATFKGLAVFRMAFILYSLANQHWYIQLLAKLSSPHHRLCIYLLSYEYHCPALQ